MTPDQKDIVKTTFALVAPIADTAATLFYDRLFALDPSLRTLFAADMTEQRRKLMIMLGTAVDNLDRLDVLVPQLRQLGRRHVAYGVTPSSYDTVGAALLSALEIGLADAFTPQVRAAWAACYTMIATTMNAAGDTSHAAGASPA